MGDRTIDPVAMRSYDEWRARKLAGMTDLSIEAYNSEQMELSAAWQLGRKAGLAGKPESADPYMGEGEQ